MSELSPVEVFGFGHCCVDYLCVLDPYPEKGKKGDVSRSLVIGGGPVPTALLTVAKFGGTTRFCGKVGPGSEGELVIQGLRQGGVDASPMIVDPDAVTAHAFIWIDPAAAGSRTIALDTTRITWPIADELPDSLPGLCRVFLCDGRAAEATLKGLKLAREAGAATVLDAGSGRHRFDEMLPLVDYALVSRDLADSFAPGADPDELARLLVGTGSGAAVVTIGEGGAVWSDGSSGGHVPGFKVEVVDSTGAGDVFHGAFIYGMLKGWGIGENILFANAAAALSCRLISGRLGIPKLEEVEKMIHNW